MGASGTTEVLTLPLERYVAATVAGEQPVGALPLTVAGAVLQVQAIVSRTYAAANRGRHRSEAFDFCQTTHCQVFRASIPTSAQVLVDAAVSATRGRVLTYRGSPIQALYHADCGGATSDAADLWGGVDQPYLIGRLDPLCGTAARGAWTWRVGTEELRQALNRDAATAVGAWLSGVTAVQTDAAGRATLVGLYGERAPMVRGEEFRRTILAAFGPRSLRSTRFTVTRAAGELVFSGRGFGHGAGLCQAGAQARLLAGERVDGVLAHYFPGAVLAPGVPTPTH